MTEETAIPAAATITLDPVKGDSPRAARRASDEAIASSTPDDNHILMRMLRMLFRPPQEYRWTAVFGVPLGSVIILVYVVAKWGVPAILAIQTLILQLHGDSIKLETADREGQREVAREQVRVNQALLDGVGKIDAKVGQINTKVDEQGQNIDRLSADVAGLKKDQAGIRAQQQAMQNRLEQPVRPPPR